MNVAIFASAFYPNLGGVEELVRQLVHAYRRKGVSAIVLTNRWPRSLPSFETYEGIPVYRLAMRVTDTNTKARISYALTERAIRGQMLRILKRHNVDLLHIQCVSCNAHWAMKAQRALKLPLVVTAQGELTMDAGSLFERSVFARLLMLETLNAADAITACSMQTLGELEEFTRTEMGIDGRARVIYNGIRLADFAAGSSAHFPVPERPYVLAIGRHVPQKGFDVLLRAWAGAVHSGTPDALAHDLVIAGDGTEHENLKQLARDLQLPQVRFVGRVDRYEAVQLFQQCAFFVLPSRHEPMGIVNLEAMASGKAIIASQVGGVPELVRSGDNGLLVPGGNVTALQTALLRLLSNPDLCKQLGAAGKSFVAQFDWQEIADSYLNVYESAIKTAAWRYVDSSATCGNETKATTPSGKAAV